MTFRPYQLDQLYEFCTVASSSLLRPILNSYNLLFYVANLGRCVVFDVPVLLWWGLKYIKQKVLQSPEAISFF